ncbi:MAG: hypothetical protein GWO24_18605 [Akkermansiaceae bacterium]|nr:hypothetical protein [Akkermansiaceae bacterium]
MDSHFSSFTYRVSKGGGWRRIKMIHIPGREELARGAVIAENLRRRESVRRQAAGEPQFNP